VIMAMVKKEKELPDSLKELLKKEALRQMSKDTLDVFEIELFDWYVKETDILINEMLSSEQTYVKEQVELGDPEPNDSGLLAVEYYTKRIRYSHIIYLVSLLERCLEEACSMLISTLDLDVKLLNPIELKDSKWNKRRKFLERYGSVKLANNLWAEPEMLIRVRNYLVHENGSTAGLSDKGKKDLGEMPGLDIKGLEFRIEAEYIKHAFKSVRTFVRAIDKEIGAVIGRVIGQSEET